MHPKNSLPVLVAGLFMVGLLLPAVTASQDVDLHPWVATAEAPRALHDALEANQHKLAAEFYDNLEYVLVDGNLRIMGTVYDRTAAEDVLLAGTQRLHWYSTTDAFMAEVTPDQLTALLWDDNLRFVEADYPIEFFMATSTMDIQARTVGGLGSAAWTFNGTSGNLDADGYNVSYTGKNVTVSVVDSGIDRTHRDFSGWGCTADILAPCDSRILAASKMETWTGFATVDDDLPTTDFVSGHGTHVAGTVLGNAYYGRIDGDDDPGVYDADGLNFGVAPEALMVSASVGDSQSAAFGVAGLEWTLDNAATYDIHIVTNSWGATGGEYNAASAQSAVVKDLYDAGILVIFAAGNDGTGDPIYGGSTDPYVISVAAYDDMNRQLASFSSRGDNTNGNGPLTDPWMYDPVNETTGGGVERHPDIGAPGVGIWSARSLTGGTSSLEPRINMADADQGSGGIRNYATMSGTSMATPHVAGAAALLVEACHDATPMMLMRALFVGAANSSQPAIQKTGGGAPAEVFEVGYGALNVTGSLDWLLSQPACHVPTPPPPPPTNNTTVPPQEPQQSSTPASRPVYRSTTPPPPADDDELDGYKNHEDNCPIRGDDQEDLNGDGLGDACQGYVHRGVTPAPEDEVVIEAPPQTTDSAKESSGSKRSTSSSSSDGEDQPFLRPQTDASSDFGFMPFLFLLGLILVGAVLFLLVRRTD